jgi:hypothetical protein
MRTEPDDHMIKLVLDTIDLMILRRDVDEASNKSVDWQEYDRLTHARDLLAECNTTTVVLQ